VAAAGTGLYVGGNFTNAGGISANRIAKWDGVQWSALGRGTSNGIDLPVLAIAASPAGALYAGGNFSQAGGVSASRIAKWDGTNWSALGSGLTSEGWIDAIAIAPNGDVYAGGMFSSVGGINANNIARWDGTNWWDVGGGVTDAPFSAVVKTIVVAGSSLYVGGCFDMAGSVPAVAIARWDGSTWVPVGGGVAYPGFNPAVYSLALDGTNLFVGGAFTQAGGVSATNIARWDGQNWFSFGTDPNGTVQSMVILENEMVVGGNFNMVGGQSLAGLARWLGNRWWPLGSGLGGPQPLVYQLAVAGGGLFVGGNFTQAGGQPSTSFARWSLTNDPPLIQLTGPTNGSRFTADETIVTSVDTASPNGAVTNVEFFANATRLGTLTNSPYTFWWTNATAGTQALRARATDQTGASQVSAPVIIWIDPPGPRITEEPHGQTLTNGAAATLTVGATGKPTLMYQWFKDGTVVAAATNAFLTITNAQLADSALYSVQVSNGLGAVTSALATISVLQPVSSIWVRPAGNASHTGPGIGEGGIVYLGTDNNSLFAFGPNGTFQWRFATSNYVQSSPAIALDGTIYFGCHDRNVYALRPDGTRKWAFTTGYTVFPAPAIGSDGTIYIGSSDTNVYALNPTGTLKWLFPTEAEILSAPAIGADGTIYIASTDGNLYALTPDGTNKWKFPTGGFYLNSPIIDRDGTIYLASLDNKLYAVQPDGSQKWAFTGIGPFSSSPVIGPDGTIYIGNDGVFDPTKGTLRGRLYAITPGGKQKWEFITGDSVRSSPAVDADGTVYFGSHDGKFYALNPNGTERWELNLGVQIESAPSIRFDGVVYFGGYDGQLYAVQGSSPLADSPWPMFQHDVRHTGNASTPRATDSWFYPFSSNAFDDEVNAVAIGGNNIYAGGNFQAAGGVKASFVAQWDGVHWSSLATGLNGAVFAIAMSGTNVYVGGAFTSAGETNANHIACWDGSQWRPLGQGMPESVFSLAISGTNLYAGGPFTTAGGIPANHVAKWDGSHWTALAGGLGGPVIALAVDGSALYAGGINFGNGNMQQWNGAQWTSLGTINGTVRAIAASSGLVYAGGDFTTINALQVNGIAEWTGSKWLALGTGVSDPVLPYVRSLAMDGTNVYAGGTFSRAGGTNADRIARWDGSRWHPLGSGLAGATAASGPNVAAIGIGSGSLFAGGAFLSAGGDPSIHYFARWDGRQWYSVGPLLAFVDGEFQFLLRDQIGRTYGVEASTDLASWIRVATFTNLGGVSQFRDNASTNLNRRFYRTVTP